MNLIKHQKLLGCVFKLTLNVNVFISSHMADILQEFVLIFAFVEDIEEK